MSVTVLPRPLLTLSRWRSACDTVPVARFQPCSVRRQEDARTDEKPCETKQQLRRHGREYRQVTGRGVTEPAYRPTRSARRSCPVPSLFRQTRENSESGDLRPWDHPRAPGSGQDEDVVRGQLRSLIKHKKPVGGYAKVADTHMVNGLCDVLAHHTCVDGLVARYYGRASSIRNLRNRFSGGHSDTRGGSNARTCHIPVVQG